MYRRSKEAKSKNQLSGSAGSLGLGLLGAGCVACSGSLLAPILGVVAANISIAAAERIGDILLVAAVMFSYWSLSRITFKLAMLDSVIINN